MDFSEYFKETWEKYQTNPNLFKLMRTQLEQIVTQIDGIASFGTNYDKAIFTVESWAGKSTFAIIDTLYLQETHGSPPILKGFSDDFVLELLDFARYFSPLLKNTLEERRTTERQAIVALKSFKEALLSKPTKAARILSDWITKWASYIHRESNFNPYKLKRYKQREFILVDFGFNVDGEFGGRHYAVVLEKDNPPKSSVILVAPITSYDPAKGQKPHPTGVDLGIGTIHNYSKGAYVVTNQIRYVSKMRIESPISSRECSQFMEFDKFQILVEKIKNKITPLTFENTMVK